MAAARRRWIAWGLRGLAVVPIAAYLVGSQAARSGGLVEVERWFNNPVQLMGAAVGLVVVSAMVGVRGWWSRTGCLISLVALGFAAVPFLFVWSVFGVEWRETNRKPGPEQPGNVLVVTELVTLDPVYRIQVLTGSGWSARHWDLGWWGEEDGRGYFRGAEWSGPNQVTVTSEKEIVVFTVDPVSGRPGEPVVTRR
ncbi:hypothetical protein [Kitasatospora griseola]|uniref:hypothetical protein n=1 Tax=Kitasatospora griseola TaxID=2064 RepID=UPI00166F7CCB|nr:hypothetical protein [Kitasatospora griseola]GGQ65144.1 hypothetical protein GCM10010195_20900 [Kitasatospora griseola]